MTKEQQFEQMIETHTVFHRSEGKNLEENAWLEEIVRSLEEDEE